MIVALVIAGMAVGGLIGTLTRRGRRVRRPGRRAIDSDRVDEQAGFRNTYGGP